MRRSVLQDKEDQRASYQYLARTVRDGTSHRNLLTSAHVGRLHRQLSIREVPLEFPEDARNLRRLPPAGLQLPSFDKDCNFEK